MATYDPAKLAVQSIRLVFVEFGTLVRLLWLPLGAMLVLQYWLGWFINDQLIQAIEAGRPDLPYRNYVVTHAVLSVVWAVLAMAMTAIVLHKLAIFKDRQPGVYGVINMSGLEWRYLFLVIMSVVLMLVVVAVPLFAVSVGVGRVLGPPREFPAPFVVMAILAVLLVMFGLGRFSAFPGHLVATGRLSWAEPWALGRGYALRFIGGYLILILIAAIAWFAVFTVATRLGVEPAQFGYYRNGDLPASLAGDEVLPFLKRANELLLLFTALEFSINSLFFSSVSILYLSHVYLALDGRPAED